MAELEKTINNEDTSVAEVKKEEKQVKNTMNLTDVLNIEGVSQFEDIAAILSLEDKVFNPLSEIILNELEKALEDSNSVILMKREMETYGLSQDQLLEEYAKIVTALDDIDTIPKNKIDFLKRYLSMVMDAFTEGQKSSKRIIEIPISLSGDAKCPKYAHVGDAGLDVYAIEDYDIEPGEIVLVKTGLKVAVPRGFELQVRPRSGTSLKTKMRVANAPGTIDSGYRGEIGIIIENIEPKIADISYTFEENPEDATHPYIRLTSIKHGKSYHIEKGERIAQLVLNEIPLAHFYEVDDIGVFNNDDRGEGGFGSSGKK